MAAALVRSGYKVQAFEIEGALVDEFSNLGELNVPAHMRLGKKVFIISTFRDACGKALDQSLPHKLSAIIVPYKYVVALVILISHVDQINDVILSTGCFERVAERGSHHPTLNYFAITHTNSRETSQGGWRASLFSRCTCLQGNVWVLDGRIMISSSGTSEAIARARPILSVMCEKLYTFEGEVGAGSKIKMVNELLEGIHLVASVEAISLGSQAATNPWMVYDIISNAAGNSWVFKNHIPQLLRGDAKPHSLNILVQKLGVILDTAKSLTFPLPLLAAAHQQLIAGSTYSAGDDDNVTLLQMHLFLGGRYITTLTRFANAGGLIGNTPAEISKDVDVLVLMVTNEAQAESVLFGHHGAVSALPSGSSVILSSTVSPGFVIQLDRRLQNEGKDLKLVDAPVSGGVKRASDGTLTIMASGADEALMHAGSVLSALSERLYVIKGGCGAGSVVKMVNQLLAGVHIASAAEAMAFAARLGLNTRMLFNFIAHSGGTSCFFYMHLSLLYIILELHYWTGSAAGWGRQDDAGVVKYYETLTGVRVEGKLPILKKETVLKCLPAEWPVDPIDDIHRLNQSNSKVLVVLDDDPTGTQTVHDIEASALIKDICRNLSNAAKSVEDVDYTVVLRGDSTLRGHFPEARTEAPKLVPAGDTEFAKDAAFGFKSSNLREWVEEKTKGRITANSVTSVSIQLLRKGGPNAVCELLCGLQKGSTCIVNAASERDMAVFAAGMIQAELKGKSFLCRTAASFVSARIGIIPKAPILPKDLGINKYKKGGLIVVGSYVPKTTKQVEELKIQCGDILRTIEVSVDKLAMKSLEQREEEISRAAEMADLFLGTCKDTLIMTSRELITGKLSSALVEIVRRISIRPRYIIAKGGITSSDLATKALEAKCAKIVGQALAGVPLWLLGPESRHPEVPYIVFPGNVGDSKALAEVVKSWACPSRLSSTKELLLNAEKGGYAIGAFNVYNMEGAEAVVAAAEEENSPAILQIHPSALKQGGIPLVAACVSAAEQANVPITVHFDHGALKQELVEALDLAELGRLSGTEDDLTVEDYEARLTDVNQAEEFIDETGIDALAVCIGNVHGKYPASGPKLRLDLLQDLHDLSSKKGVVLVLHGASGLPKELVKACIERGVRKFNVNTEVRKAYMDSLSSPKKDLVHVIASAKEAMKAVVAEKMHLFGSAGRA
ncbi:hypothetical protein GH714_023711 [Hevea brasiliensis]|uniref:Ketose-bisphosphate aldolase class-II family protein n=1 Tax=Hevea brasiliensis TaxID=3981 RepID=A0A6A6MVE5_HEVBR|nr:hypothetical protein GH714_023711 [Hevea brasiliensis]